jgi:hypothetical protein
LEAGVEKPRLKPSRSVRAASDYKDLEEFFKATDGEVSTFVDVLKQHHGELEDRDLFVARKLASGQPDKVIAPKRFTMALSGFVRIFHGWHNKDYVWHIEHAAIRRPWKVPLNRVIYIIAKSMHDILPDIDATIWPPQYDWELKTITFKALNLSNEWSFSEDLIEKINNRLFDLLNKVC